MYRGFFKFVFYLLIIIGLLGAYIRFVAAPNESSWFNIQEENKLSWRMKFAKTELYREWLDLNQAGDGAIDYLRKNLRNGMLIEYDYVEGCSFSESNMAVTRSILQELLNKPLDIDWVTDQKISSSNIGLSDERAKSIEIENRTLTPGSHRAYLHIVCLDGHSSGVKPAMTIGSDAIVLFSKDIKKLVGTTREKQQNLMKLSILHEFGRLITLPDSEDDKCIMHDSFESLGRGSSRPIVASRYCSSESSYILKLRQAFNR